MKRRSFKTVLSVLLAAMMIVSAMTLAVSAAGETANEISSISDIESGSQYVIVASNGKAMTTFVGGDNPWVLAESVTAENGAISNVADNLKWTITVSNEGGVDYAKLTDSNGVTIAPKGGNNNGVKEADYKWIISDNGGEGFTFKGVDSDTVILASNEGSDGKFRGYKTSTVSGNATGYPSVFALYEIASSGSGSTGGTTPTPTPDPIEFPDNFAIKHVADNKYVTGTKYVYTSNSGSVKDELELATDVTGGLVFTVVENSDDTVSFKAGDKYLYADGTNVRIVDAEGDNTKFVVEEANNGYYIKCANATFNNKAQYLEVYGGCLTCYSMGSNTDLFIFTFEEVTVGNQGGNEGGNTGNEGGNTGNQGGSAATGDATVAFVGMAVIAIVAIAGAYAAKKRNIAE